VTLKGQGRDPNTLRAQYLKTAGNRGGYYPSWRPSVGDLDVFHSNLKSAHNIDNDNA